MISPLVAALRHIDPEITDRDIADVLWLTIQMRKAGETPEFDEEMPADYIAPVSEESSKQLQGESHDFQPEPHVSKPFVSAPTPTSTRSGLYPPYSQGHRGSQLIKTAPFRSPAAPALPGSLEIARVLRPFGRRVRQQGTTVLNEEATAKRIAEEEIWVPVLDNASTRWLEVALVLDIGKSMTIWRQTTTELLHLFAHHGAFRDVRLWELDTNDGKTAWLYAGTERNVRYRQPRSELELIDTSSRRLILVVTDCVSAAWHSGVVTEKLAKWGHYNPVTLIQVLPRRLWSRTALGIATPVQLHAGTPGASNKQLQVQSAQYWDEEELVPSFPVPIVTLDPKSLAAWAQAIARAEDVWISGFEFGLPFHTKEQQESEEYVSYKESLSVKHPAAELVQRFRANASIEANRLVEYMAVVPITLPVIRLIQQAMFLEPRQVHVAEVLLSGLLEVISKNSNSLDPDDVEYDFVEGVRELLLNFISPSDSSIVLTEISSYITSKFAHPIDFTALLANPFSKEGLVIDQDNLPFALLGAKALRRFGGEYELLASWLENQSVEAEGYIRDSHFKPHPEIARNPSGENMALQPEETAGYEIVLRVKAEESGVKTLPNIGDEEKLLRYLKGLDALRREDSQYISSLLQAFNFGRSAKERKPRRFQELAESMLDEGNFNRVFYQAEKLLPPKTFATFRVSMGVAQEAALVKDFMHPLPEGSFFLSTATVADLERFFGGIEILRYFVIRDVTNELVGMLSISDFVPNMAAIEKLPKDTLVTSLQYFRREIETINDIDTMDLAQQMFEKHPELTYLFVLDEARHPLGLLGQDDQKGWKTSH